MHAWPYFPKDKIICTCKPSISREQIQSEIDNFPQGLYGMFSSDWNIKPVSVVEITNDVIAFSCGDLTECIYRDDKCEWGFYKGERND